MGFPINPVNCSHFDGNQVPTVTGVIGTLGTADTKGTSLALPMSVDPSTGAAYVYNLGPAGTTQAAGTQDVNLLQIGGTPVSGQMYDSANTAIKVNVVAGGAGGGVAQLQVRNAAATAWVDVGYASTTYVPITSMGGTLNAATVGTVTGVGIVSNLTQGSINITAGTIGAATINTIGTLTNLVNGTIQNSGTVTGVGVVSMLTGGTVNSATINAGTIRDDGRSARNILSYGTTFGATAASYATLVGSAVVGVGTSLWVNDISIVNSAGTVTSLVGFGTVLNGTSVLVKGNFGPQGGIEKSYSKAVNAGMTNSDLVCYVASAGTIDVSVSYFISA